MEWVAVDTVTTTNSGSTAWHFTPRRNKHLHGVGGDGKRSFSSGAILSWSQASLSGNLAGASSSTKDVLPSNLEDARMAVPFMKKSNSGGIGQFAGLKNSGSLDAEGSSSTNGRTSQFNKLSSLSEEADEEKDEDEEMTSSSSTSTAEIGINCRLPDHRLLTEFGEDWPLSTSQNEYEVLHVPVIRRVKHTGLEPSRNFSIVKNGIIGCRYQIVEYVGAATFSIALQCIDLTLSEEVCLKIIKNNKDFLDQGIDEVRLLQLINNADPKDTHHLLRYYSHFYFKEHLIIVTELLKDNLYEVYRHFKKRKQPSFFNMWRLQKVTKQILTAIAFIHDLDLIHSDIKPENILIKSYSKCKIKVVDFGSSCFQSDTLSTYVQSRSYRAPEVLLGCPYDQKIDVWSIGCVVGELVLSEVVFESTSSLSLLGRIQSVLGSIPNSLFEASQFQSQYFGTDGKFLGDVPRRTSLAEKFSETDPVFQDFLAQLLQFDPNDRPTCKEALQHEWFDVEYEQ
eukprot:TRINITY_DN2296_c0_g1_i5.p1 TRINITY_DN2296_c0_g1~~TRINITY_DN2296_c0_g1_i5.p1  ORF type:complete len:509 (-),score=124.88 TRINITY_DN2296_c0_g1_i5:20-1546(-)